MSHIRVSHSGNRCIFVCVNIHTHMHVCIVVLLVKCVVMYVYYMHVFMCIHTYMCVKQTNIGVGVQRIGGVTCTYMHTRFTHLHTHTGVSKCRALATSKVTHRHM